jgi:hypothetical protein
MKSQKEPKEWKRVKELVAARNLTNYFSLVRRMRIDVGQIMKSTLTEKQSAKCVWKGK